MQKAQPSRAFSGEKFRELRKAAGVKGSDICRATGFHQNTVSAWATGRYIPSLESLIVLADILGCRVDDFFVSVKEASDAGVA